MQALEHKHSYDFGRNWRSYTQIIDDRAIDGAKIGLSRLAPSEIIEGARFLDIGCGSGIHAVAATMLGADVTAIDRDEQAVRTARALFAHYGLVGNVSRRSVFEIELGRFDIVYAWGSLHHTGDLWRALDRACSHVGPGGLLIVAVYDHTPLCRAWQIEKRMYSRLPPWARALPRALFGSALLARLALSSKRSPREILASYWTKRGMDFWHDVDDWLGGYPYQSATNAEVIRFARARGFRLSDRSSTKRTIGLFGAGCCEYVFVQGNASTRSIPDPRFNAPPLSFCKRTVTASIAET